MPGTRKYAAFLSYAHRYREWVGAFHGDLEACLKRHGEHRPVFLDQEGLRPGDVWGAQLETALAESERFVPVLTPEAFASPWVQAEHEAFRADHPYWHRGFFVPVRLVESPLPPLAAMTQYVDFLEHDDDGYCRGLQQVLARLLDSRSTSHLPELAEELALPACPRPEQPRELRARLVAAMAPAFARRLYVRACAEALGLEPYQLEGLPLGEVTASAALVLAEGADTANATAIRVIDQLTRALGDDEPEIVARLQESKAALVEHRTRDRRETPVPEAGASMPLLELYCQNLVNENERLVDHFHRDQVLQLLDRVFVDLELRQRHLDGSVIEPSGWARPRPGSGTGEPLGRARTSHLLDLIHLGPDDAPWITRRWIVLGDPGSGKTTLLRHLAWRLASSVASGAKPAQSGEASRPIPVLASLPRLLRQGRDPLAAAEEDLRKSGVPAEGLERVLDSEGQAGTLVVLLDGLDEVPAEDRQAAENLITRLRRRFPDTTLVIASRPVGYRPPAIDGVEIELQPLERERRLELLARWFGRGTGEPDRARAEQKLPLLERDRGLWELAGNPLYLTLMALILEEDQVPEQNRARLYDQIFDLLLEGRYRRPEGEAPRPLEPKARVREALRHLAYGMTEDNRDSESVDATVERLYREDADVVRQPLERIERWRSSMRTFLEDVAERSGIYGPHDGASADWKFWHRTFREALAAERLEQVWQVDGQQSILERARALAGDEGRWAEPYALFTGRVEDPDALVESLLEANRPLALRALATAPRLAEGTLERVLGLTADPDERGEVLRSIPRLLGDPESGLLLIDRLRRDTRNGDDLFFLYLAVEETMAAAAEKSPAVETDGRELLERFFDHVPVPPAGLFETLATRDGEVPLWATIPAGSFQMGSSEGVGYDDERPQHEVTLAEPFRLGCVPVTNRQYAAFDPGHAWEEWGGLGRDELGDHPVVNVSWYAATVFCRWLSGQSGLAGARLPTEEAWEYACRAGTSTAYWAGDSEEDLERVGWCHESSKGRAHRVGEKLANAWGLYDVHGNVWEWCESRWRDDYASEPEAEGDPTRGFRVLRGGSWVNDAGDARSAYRLGDVPRARLRDFGFRVRLPAAPSSSS